MAELNVEGDELVLHLSGQERLEAIHGDLRAPLSTIRSVEILNDAHKSADRGVKFGTRIARVVEVATITSKGKRIFAVVHHDTPRGIQINFDGAAQDAWIVGCPNPEEVAALIPIR